MKLILAKDDGEIIATWNIEEDFGDLEKPLPVEEFRSEVVTEILIAQRRAKGTSQKEEE